MRQESTEKSPSPEPVPASEPQLPGLIQRLMIWTLSSSARFFGPNPLGPFFPLRAGDFHSLQLPTPVPFLWSGSANGLAGCGEWEERESMVLFHGSLLWWDSDNGCDGRKTTPSAGSPCSSSPADLPGRLVFLYTWPLLCKQTLH